MASLYDTIQQNSGQIAATTVPQTGETQKVQSLLRARSGRAGGGGSEAGISNLGEQAAVATGNAQIQQMQPALQTAQEQQNTKQEAQAGQTAQSKAELDQSRKFSNLQTAMQANQILRDLERDRGSIDLQKDKGRLEQASFLLAMQNKQYVQQLQDVGRRRRLDDATTFQNEMEKQVLGDNLDLLKKQIGTQSVLQMNDTAFRKQMSQMSIEEAQKVAANEMAHQSNLAQIKEGAVRGGADISAAAANSAAKYSGYSSILTGATGAYGAYDKMDSRPEVPGATPEEPGIPYKGVVVDEPDSGFRAPKPSKGGTA